MAYLALIFDRTDREFIVGLLMALRFCLVEVEDDCITVLMYRDVPMYLGLATCLSVFQNFKAFTQVQNVTAISRTNDNCAMLIIHVYIVCSKSDRV